MDERTTVMEAAATTWLSEPPPNEWRDRLHIIALELGIGLTGHMKEVLAKRFSEFAAALLASEPDPSDEERKGVATWLNEMAERPDNTTEDHIKLRYAAALILRDAALASPPRDGE